jgi:hypothetical protein
MAAVESGAVTRSKITEIHPMFTVAAVLPFLPLIEDAMIRQLGDDDFAKREAATRFLERMLKATNGIRNYWMLAKIVEAKASKDAETRNRAKIVFLSCQPRIITNTRALLIAMFQEDDGQEISNPGAVRLYKEIELLLRKRIGVTGSTRDKKYYCLCYVARELIVQDICLLRSHRNFKGFVIIDNPRDWIGVVNNLHKKKQGEGFRTFP